MSIVLAVIALLLAVVVGGIAQSAFDSTFAGMVVAIGVIILYGLPARENHSRKVRGEPPLVQFRSREASDDDS
jgi:biopolymer transport protein ExbB/TolQ